MSEKNNKSEAQAPANSSSNVNASVIPKLNLRPTGAGGAQQNKNSSIQDLTNPVGAGHMKDIADFVDPVPEDLVNKYPSVEQDSVRRGYRILHRMNTQQQELIAEIESKDEERLDGGKIIVEPKMYRVPTRPSTASSLVGGGISSRSGSARSTRSGGVNVLRTPSSGNTKIPSMQQANSATPDPTTQSPGSRLKPKGHIAQAKFFAKHGAATHISIPKSLAGFTQLASQRRDLLSSGKVAEAIKLFLTPTGVLDQQLKDNTATVPRPPSGKSSVSQVVVTTKDTFTPTERIGQLMSNCPVRTGARDNWLEPISTRKSYREGPGPVPATSPRNHDGIVGSDPTLSHFLDINDYDDMELPTEIVEGTPSCIAWSRYYVPSEDGSGNSEIGARTVMEPCKIMAYDAKENKYIIRWIKSGKIKTVKPLTLKFHDESDAEHAGRVRRAEIRRDQEEAKLRFCQYVASQKLDIEPQETEEVERILSSVATEVPQRHVDVIETCLDEIEAKRTYAIKRAIVLYRLRSEKEQGKLSELRFEIPKPAKRTSMSDRGEPEANLKGIYSCVSVIENDPVMNKNFKQTFLKRREQIQDELFVSHPALYTACRFAVNRWFAFEKNLLVLVDIDVLSPPLEVDVFAFRQQKHNETVSFALSHEWMQSIVGCLQSELHATFNFFEDNVERFYASRMFRYLRRINLCLSGQLQGLVYSSLQELELFMRTLRVDQEMMDAFEIEEGGGNQKKSRCGHDFLRLIGCVAKRRIVPASYRLIDAESVPAEPFGEPSAGEIGNSGISGVVPLLVLRLEIDNGVVRLEPSLERVHDAMNTLYDNIFSTTDEINDLGSSLFPILEVQAVPLTKRAQQLRETDERVISCRKELDSVLKSNTRGPELLLKLYKQFEYLAKINIDEFVEEFGRSNEEKPKPQLQDYEHICDRLTEHIAAVRSRSLNEVVFPLLKVETYQLKKDLCSKAQNLLTGILDHLTDRSEEKMDSIMERYKEIYERLQVEPTTPEELSELKSYIDEMPLKLNALSDEFDQVTDNVQLLSKYGVMPHERAFEKYWYTQSWPRNIAILMNDVPFHLQSYRAQFLNELHQHREQLIEEIRLMTIAVGKLSEEADEHQIDKMINKVTEMGKKLEDLRIRGGRYNEHEQIFQQPITKWTILKETEKTFQPYALLWKVASDSRQIDVWLDSLLEKLTPEDVVNSHTQWTKDIAKLTKVLSKEAPFSIVQMVKEKLDEFKPNLPLIVALAKPSLLSRTRHMNRIGDLIGVEKFTLTGKSLQDVLNLKLNEHIPEIQELSENADHEYKLEFQLSRMRDEWQKVAFRMQDYDGTFLLKDTEDIRNFLDETMLKTQTMLASPYAAAILNELKPWEQQLTHMSNVFDEWMKCQFGFHYLQPIFSHRDITAAMPDEARLFEAVALLWNNVMENCHKNPYVTSRTADTRLLGQFRDANEKLDRILKELAKFLDTKRVVFPRFYFLSNEDLIEILSESKEPQLVQPHLKKCFEGIHRLTFRDTDITEMISAEKEAVKFVTPVNPTDSENVVEKWLLKVEAAMRETIRDNVKRAIMDYKSRPRTEWVQRWPGQVVICASQLQWTSYVEKSIVDRNLHECAAIVKSQLDDLVLLVRGELTPVMLCTLQAMVVIEVHSRDITFELAKEGVDSVGAFSWIAQLRYYWEKENVTVRQTIAGLPYGYEYIGNTSRLVITPLTDRCYRTLTAAYHLNYGGAPEGPAGTGKTETTKDLAKAIGKQCVVYNCSEQIKAVEMEKLLRGLASAGAWGCFDEFNRIEIQVLSVIAQQVLQIQLAVARKLDEFLFEGKLCALKVGCSMFVTMNPGYAGRAELPDNLKALFRPVAMMVPDYALIAENSLFSCGFLQATVLSKKIVSAYKLCSEQLSSQSHYDYGMRAVKSVLTAAQNLKPVMKDCDEAQVVLRAILDVNVPKFLASDANLFKGIISDLFGQITLPLPDYTDLNEGLKVASQEGNFQLTPFFDLKIKQFFEMICVRHGVMVVGQSFSGKTASLKTLAKGLSWVQKETGSMDAAHIHVMNPKSVTMDQLYGHSDVTGTEWHDGILSTIFRACANDNRPDRQWVTLDGPVDAMWIENMNTVLDDNKKLCLTNGDIIRMSDSMTMVFVVQDLFAASPATVSRCGMVYYEPKELGWQPLFDSWMNTLPPFIAGNAALVECIHTMVNAIVPLLCDFIQKQPIGMETSNQILCASLFRFMGILLSRTFLTPEEQTTEEAMGETDGSILISYVEACFVFSALWSFGSVLKSAGRDVFEPWLRTVMDNDSRNKGMVYKVSCPYPEHGSLYGHNLWIPPTFDSELKWVDWMNMELFGEEFAGGPSMAEQLEAEAPYHEIIVPTADTACYAFMATILVQAKVPLLLVGATGTGKTLVLKSAITKQLSQATFCNCIVQFSAQTKALQLQSVVDSKLERRGGRKYGPPVGKQMVLFVDDLGMPEADQYGTQPPIELLRQLLTSGGWFGGSKNETGFKTILNTVLVAATQPSDGGRASITKRLTRHFHSLFVPAHTQEGLKRIFNQLFDYIIQSHAELLFLRNMRDGIVGFVTDVFQGVSESMLPTPEKSHYNFNLRDLCRVFQGLASVDPHSMKEENHLVTAVSHECVRVFGDRLTTAKDREALRGIMKDKMTNRLRKPFDIIMEEPLLYGDFFGGPEDRVYCKLESAEKAKEVMENFLMQHNEDVASRSGRMNLVIFDYMVEHVTRVCRIIQQPFGSAMLIGVGGSGRQSVARLATFIAGYSLKNVSISKKYNKDVWRDDIGSVLRFSGEKNNSTTFLLSDTQIKDESFLEDVCNILNTGEVPGIFGPDIYDNITDALRSTAKDMGRDYSKEGCWELFVMRCRTNLHFCLCMSPVGDGLRIRLRRFPSLVNCTTIDWFEEWPQSGLYQVAHAALSTTPSNLLQEERVSSVTDIFVQFHRDISKETKECMLTKKQAVTSYITPTSFLELISFFQNILKEKTHELRFNSQRYFDGLEMMRKTEIDVKEMQALLGRNKPIIEAANTKTAELIVTIDKETAEADQERAIVAVEEAQANAIAESARAVKEDCEANLSEALPALNAALNAVSSIDKRQLVEIKSMQNPTEKVKKVIEAVCVLLDVPPKEIRDPLTGKKEIDYWTPARTKVMADAETFKKLLTDYDKENMREDLFEGKIQPYIKDRNFKPEAVANVSQALVGVCTWVLAMETYYRVYKKVKPKKIKLAGAEEELRKATAILNEKMEKLRIIEERLKNLKESLEETTAEKKRLELEQQTTEIKLSRAVKLLDLLGGEKGRYEEESRRLGQQLSTVLGDSILTAGFLVYLGPFTNDLRMQHVESWKDFIQNKKSLEISKSYSLETFLSSSLTTLHWKVSNLPDDNFSIDSAIIVQHSRRYPLIVDPQGQANIWIKTLDRNRGRDTLVVIRPTESTFQGAVIHAVQHGYPLLIEDCTEELDPFLYPLLLGETTMFQGKKVLALGGDTYVPMHPDFRLYMTTKIANPTFFPETATKVAVVAFFITPPGLQEQVLQRIIRYEEREKELERNRYIEQGASGRQQLKNIEDGILEKLSSGEDLLASDEINHKLEHSKKTSSDVEDKLEEIETFQKSFEKIRVRFLEMATRVSQLFFIVTGLSNVDPMYHFSLQWYFMLLQKALEGVERVEDESREERVNAISSKFMDILFRNVTRSLFAKDQLVYSFLFAARMADVPGNEMGFLATGGLDMPFKLTHPPCPAWMMPPTYELVCRLTEQVGGVYPSLAADVAIHDEYKFQSFLMESGANLPPLSPQYDVKISAFQKLILVRCLRPDRLVQAVRQFVGDTQGNDFLRPAILNLNEVVNESKGEPTVPFIFLLSPGGDPMAALRRLAEQHGMLEDLDTLSLGHGMGERAKQLIEAGKTKGRWVLLQNCHLYQDWLPTLDRIIEDFSLSTKKNIIGTFRLWLTSMPSPFFPPTLLQRGVKMVVEPPKGVKANLSTSYHMDPINDENFFEKCANSAAWKRLCFALCLFHAVIQERRSFGSLGWNIPYEFNDTDLRISLRQLHMFISDAKTIRDIPFDTLQYLIGECNYGGRVTDAHDRVLMTALLSGYISPGTLLEGVQFDPASLNFPLPPEGKCEAYLEEIGKLPEVPMPSIFGLNTNANITKNERETSLFLDAVAATLPKTGGGEGEGGSAADQNKKQVEKICLAMLERIRAPYDVSDVETRRPMKYEDSMNTVLNQEILRFNRLIVRVRSTMQALVRAIRGEIVFSSDLDAMTNDILLGKIPSIWEAYSYPSLKPFGAYINDLVKRLEMFDNWITDGPPKIFWLAGFFFPQSFITGVLQNYSRSMDMTIDSLHWEVQILNDEPQMIPDSGCFISGLFMEGAGWNGAKNELCESQPKALFIDLPVLWLIPVSNEGSGEDQTEGGEGAEQQSSLKERAPSRGPFTDDSGFGKVVTYPCPVYRTTARRGVLMTTGHSTNFIMHFDLPIPSDTTPQFWTKRGVAIITALNY